MKRPTRPSRFARVTAIMRGMGVLVDAGTWIVPGKILACADPRRGAGLAALAQQGVSLVVNLHERAHEPSSLACHGLSEVHLPVRDFTAPTQEQIGQAVAALKEAVGAGRTVAVHCGAGLGRTGTILACYLVRTGVPADDAIRHIRALRPGSVETADQLDAVHTYARRLREDGAPGVSGDTELAGGGLPAS